MSFLAVDHVRSMVFVSNINSNVKIIDSTPPKLEY